MILDLITGEIVCAINELGKRIRCIGSLKQESVMIMKEEKAPFTIKMIRFEIE